MTAYRMRLKDISIENRPLERLAKFGEGALSDVESLLVDLEVPREEYSSFFFVMEELEKGGFIRINPHDRVLNQVYVLDFSGKLFVEHLRLSHPEVRQMIKKVSLAIS